MTFKEEMDKFFDGFSPYECDRKSIEADSFYQLAANEENVQKATVRAIELIPALGNVKSKAQMRSKLKKARKGKFIDFS